MPVKQFRKWSGTKLLDANHHRVVDIELLDKTLRNNESGDLVDLNTDEIEDPEMRKRAEGSSMFSWKGNTYIYGDYQR